MLVQALVDHGRQDIAEGWRHLHTGSVKYYDARVRSLLMPTDVTVCQVHAPQDARGLLRSHRVESATPRRWLRCTPP